MSGPRRTLAVVPTYEEAGNVEELIAGIALHAPEVELLFVDDAGRDGTADRVAACGRRERGRVHLLRRAQKLGIGRALVAGFGWALREGYEEIVQMDADLSHRPSDLPRLLEGLARSPVVVGSRYVTGGGVENWSPWRQAVSRFAGIYTRAILGMDLRDPTSGFCAWRRQALERIGIETLRSDGYLLEIELKHRARLAGIALEEAPIVFVERRAGKSKMSGRAILESAAGVWRLARETGRLFPTRSRRTKAA